MIKPTSCACLLIASQSWDDDGESSDLAVGETIKNLSKRGPLSLKKPAPKPSPQLDPPVAQPSSEPNEPPAVPEERSSARKPGKNRVQFAEQISKSKVIEDLPATLSTANGIAARNGAGGSAASAIAAAAGTAGYNAATKKPAAGKCCCHSGYQTVQVDRLEGNQWLLCNGRVHSYKGKLLPS